MSISQRSLVLIDGDNLLFSARELDIALDFQKLRESLVQRFGPSTRMKYYGGIASQAEMQTAVLKAISELHCEVRIEYDSQVNRSDSLIFIDAMSLSKDFETVVLLSGDGDFVTLVKALRDQGKRIIVIGLPFVTSKQLKENADQYINLEDFLANAASSPGATTVVPESPAGMVAAETYYLEKGIYFDSYVKVRCLLLSAKASVTVIDQYVDEDILLDFEISAYDWRHHAS